MGGKYGSIVWVCERCWILVLLCLYCNVKLMGGIPVIIYGASVEVVLYHLDSYSLGMFFVFMLIFVFFFLVYLPKFQPYKE